MRENTNLTDQELTIEWNTYWPQTHNNPPALYSPPTKCWDSKCEPPSLAPALFFSLIFILTFSLRPMTLCIYAMELDLTK